MAQRMAGEALSVKERNKFRKGQKFRNEEGELYDIGKPDRENPDTDNNPYTVSDLSDFDMTGGGAGASKGAERLSKQDLRRLFHQGGHSKEDLIAYADSYSGDGPGASGAGAQKLLNRWRNKLGQPEEETPVDDTPEDDTPVDNPATPPPSEDPKPVGPIIIKPGKPGTSNQNQIVNQDNDITTNITGDNNTVTNTVDNSVTQSGMIDGNYAQRFASGLKDQYVLNLLGR